MDNQNYAAQFYSGISNEIDLLEKNMEEYPASSVGRFIWLYHLKKNNDPRINEVAIQTGIYLNNPLWMEYQLSKSGISINTVNEEISQNPILENESTEIKDEEIINEPSQEIENDNSVDFNEQKAEQEIAPETVNKEISGNLVLENEVTEIKNDNPVDFNEQKTEEEITPETVNEQISLNPILETEVKEINNENLVDFNEQKAEQEIAPETVNEEISQNPILEKEEDNINEDELVIQENPTEENQIVSDKTFNTNENPGKEMSIPFEPLHTVDYFASQGIKLSEEALANDQLGQQVKSFTAWLKSMKKLHPGKLPEQNEVIEKIIQSSSEASNQNANVLTEAMAEVLVKQGKREKAVEMYEKLSLINPSKSAYFAAKIEILKTI